MTLPLAALLQGAVAGGPTGQTYVDDVFSTYLYTGNSSTQTITNGIDLAGKGGMVWIKCRTAGQNNNIFDTARGAYYKVLTNTTGAQTQNPPYGLTSFNSNGFTLNDNNSNEVNASNASQTYTSWTFRKAPKFFDMVTFTGDGTTNGSKSVSHSLGVMPGMVIIKRTDGVGDWAVTHRNAPSNGTSGSLAGPYNYGGQLNTTAAFSNLSAVYSASATDIKVIDANGENINGATYVAYLFAHDTSTDGIIQCGSFTTDGSGNATVTLGWEPQYLMFKRSDAAGNWLTLDQLRGWSVTYGTTLNPNLANAESSAFNETYSFRPTATGFNLTNAGIGNNATYIYLAIRRPNKPPTSGTQVYNAIAYTANDTDGRKLSGIGFPPDLVSIDPRSSYTTPGGPNWFSRLTGNGRFLTTASTSAELDGSSNSNGILGQDDFTVSRFGTNVWSNVGSYLYILHAFRRAPGVFDVVCGDSGNATVARAHSLGVKPELIIAKYRDLASQWDVYCDRLNGGVNQEDYYLELNGISAQMSSTDVWGAAGPSASYFYKSVVASYKAVFYLFASKAGISKVGSYTGNGSSQTINCGFSTGARFILIKRTDSTGDWYVWDSARGIVAGNDPHLSLNTTAAEVTTDDSIDPDNSGFIVNQIAATNINVSSASYIFLALS